MIVGGLIPNMNAILNELIGVTPLAASPDEQILLLCIASEISSILFLMPGYGSSLYDSVIAWLNYYIADVNTIKNDVGEYLSICGMPLITDHFLRPQNILSTLTGTLSFLRKPSTINLLSTTLSFITTEHTTKLMSGSIARLLGGYTVSVKDMLPKVRLSSIPNICHQLTLPVIPRLVGIFRETQHQVSCISFKKIDEYNNMPIVQVADANDYKFKVPQNLPISVNMGNYKIGFASWGSYYIFGRVSKGEADFTIVGIYSLVDVPVLYDNDKTNSQMTWSFELFDSQSGIIKNITDITTYTRIKTSLYMFELGDIVSCENQGFSNGIVYSRILQDLGQYSLRSYAVAYGGSTWWIPEILLRKEGQNKQFLTQPPSVGWWNSVGQWLGFKSTTDYNEITNDLNSVQAALVKKDEEQTNVDRLLSQKGYELNNNIALAGAATAFLLLLFLWIEYKIEFLVAASIAGIAYLWGSDEETPDELEMIRSTSPHKIEVDTVAPDRTVPNVTESLQNPSPSLSSLDRAVIDDIDKPLVDKTNSLRPEHVDNQTRKHILL